MSKICIFFIDRQKSEHGKQAQELLNRYLPSIIREMKAEEIERSFNRLFGNELIPPEQS